MYDATEIFRSLSGHKKESFMKLGFYLLSFFYYLYRCVLLPLPLYSMSSLDGLQDDRCPHLGERVGTPRGDARKGRVRVFLIRRPARGLLIELCKLDFATFSLTLIHAPYLCRSLRFVQKQRHSLTANPFASMCVTLRYMIDTVCKEHVAHLYY